MSNYVTATSSKKKKTALIICALGGYIGLHYYYVGRIGMGLLYTFTVGFAGIGWIIDIIKIALGNFKDNTGVALRE
jgi:TM2 domain-containing membrane protein YozV